MFKWLKDLFSVPNYKPVRIIRSRLILSPGRYILLEDPKTGKRSYRIEGGHCLKEDYGIDEAFLEEVIPFIYYLDKK